MSRVLFPNALIDDEQVAARTFELVSIPSPTGASDAVAERYAAMLEELDLEGLSRSPLRRRPERHRALARRRPRTDAGLCWTPRHDPCRARSATPDDRCCAWPWRGRYERLYGGGRRSARSRCERGAPASRARWSSPRTRYTRHRSARWKGYAGSLRRAFWVTPHSSPNPFQANIKSWPVKDRLFLRSQSGVRGKPCMKTTRHVELSIHLTSRSSLPQVCGAATWN